MKEEPFGPIVPILTFKSFDEVMKRANDNDLGLCSYVYTTDLKKANEASEILETGCVAVNTPAVAVAEAPLVELNKQVMEEKVAQWPSKII